MSEFNASVFVSEQLTRQLMNTSQDLAYRCIAACAEHYHFDAEEAYRLLGLAMIRVERKTAVKEKKGKITKVAAPKSAFPLPYNGEFNDSYCYALRQNNGLYTQCTSVRKGEAQFCKSCATTMQKTGAEVPEYGTIQMRQAVGIFEYVDPKGRKPVSYTKIMKKYKFTEEQAVEEAGKLNITINPEHFVVADSETKRGRPKAEKEPKAKGAKGRPKKSKKVLQIEGDEEDLFATLVANANEDSDDEMVITSKSSKKSSKSDEEKEAERLALAKQKEAEKETKRLAAEQAKAEKEAKIAAEKAEKEAKKEAERLAREEKKKAEEAEKEAKRIALENAKKEKEAKIAAEKAAKEAAKALADQKKTSKKAAVPPAPLVANANEEVEDEEPDVVKKIEFEGKKYLKSKKTGIVYDYNEYVKNGEQVVVGKWNETSNKIEFQADEEEEEEYDL